MAKPECDGVTVDERSCWRSKGFTPGVFDVLGIRISDGMIDKDLDADGGVDIVLSVNSFASTLKLGSSDESTQTWIFVVVGVVVKAEELEKDGSQVLVTDEETLGATKLGSVSPVYWILLGVGIGKVLELTLKGGRILGMGEIESNPALGVVDGNRFDGTVTGKSAELARDVDGDGMRLEGIVTGKSMEATGELNKDGVADGKIPGLTISGSGTKPDKKLLTRSDKLGVIL